MSSDLSVKGDSVGPAIQRYQSAVDDFDRETARLLGVNATDLRCLELLLDDTETDVTPRTIADRLALTTGSVTTMLDRLERAGYVIRIRHEIDRRKVLVQATPTARQRTWELIGPLLDDASQEVVAQFSAEELATVERFITRATTTQLKHVTRLRAREHLA